MMQLHDDKHHLGIQTPEVNSSGLFVSFFQVIFLVLLHGSSPFYSFLLFFTNSSDLRNDL